MSDRIQDARIKGGWAMFDTALFDYGLSAYSIAVYVALLKYANSQTDMAFPGINSLSRMIKVAPNTTRKSLQELETVGIIKITRRPNKETGVHETNLYTLLPMPHRGTSPHEVGVLHHMKYGTSPREDKPEEVNQKKKTSNLSPSGDPAPTTSKTNRRTPKDPNAIAGSKLTKEDVQRLKEQGEREALINTDAPAPSFDDFGDDAWSKPASRTDGLFDAVFEVFGITDAEKRPNSYAGKFVSLLFGKPDEEEMDEEEKKKASLKESKNDEWYINALPKKWGFTGKHLVQWSHWYQETVLKNDPNMNMPSKPGLISGSIQGWWAKGRPLSSKDAAMGRTVQQPSKTVVEEVPMSDEDRQKIIERGRAMLNGRLKRE